MSTIRWHICIVSLIIIPLDIAGMLDQSTLAAGTYEEEFFDEKLQPRVITEQNLKSLSTYVREMSLKFRILASSGVMFCVASATADPTALAAGLNWACGPGMANCSAIQPGQPCYQPNNLTELASYAYNDYYQRTEATGGTCNFNDTAVLTPTNPSYGTCIFTGSIGTNPGTNSSITPSPPTFSASPTNGSSPPFSLTSSSSELHVLPMANLILVLLHFYIMK